MSLPIQSVELDDDKPLSHKPLVVEDKLPRISKVVVATVDKVSEVVEVVVIIHSGRSRPDTVLHNLSRSLANFLEN